MKDAILKDLRLEIERLQHELKVELPREIKKARELGDLSENAEYNAAKERQVYVRARLGQLEERYKQLGMLDFNKIPRDRVGLGSEVELQNLNNDEVIIYRIVIAEQADAAAGNISSGSPIGRALLGKIDGDEVTVVVPSGVREFEILSFKTIYDRLGP
jgi:transcription elongation factor GreA